MTSKAMVVNFGKPDSDEVKIQKAAKFCRDHILRSAMAIIECGRELALLKSSLREDEKWLAAFGEDRARKQIADNPFPFGSRKADMLIQAHARLSAGTRVPAAQLPASWRTLYELSKLSDKQLEVVRDKIHPMMTVSEASGLRPKKTTKRTVKVSRDIDKAHDIYLRLPKKNFLKEIAALIRDRGINADELINAMENEE